MSEIHNLFASHRHEDDGLVEGLRNLLAPHNVEFRNASITEDDPNDAKSVEYIQNQILAPGIRWAGKLVVLITPDTCNHWWVDWEIAYAMKLTKPIIAIWGPDSEGCELPEALKQHADDVVSWNADKIIDALNGAQCWENPDGSPRDRQSIDRLCK